MPGTALDAKHTELSKIGKIYSFKKFLNILLVFIDFKSIVHLL